MLSCHALASLPGGQRSAGEVLLIVAAYHAMFAVIVLFRLHAVPRSCGYTWLNRPRERGKVQLVASVRAHGNL